LVVRAINKTVLILVAALTAASIAGCMPGGARSKGPRYLTEKVVVADVERTVLGSGALEPLEVVNVGAQASGQIRSMKVELGDNVRRGQVIAVIDPSTQEVTLKNAEAALQAAQAQKAQQEARLAQDEVAFRRQSELLAKGFAARSAYDSADATVKTSRAGLRANDAQIRQAEIRVEEAKIDLSRTNIVAPIDGVVTAILVREGQTVNSFQSAPTIVRLAKMDIMTVKAQISEADVINVFPGQKVWFTILGDPNKRYYATLRTVEPSPAGGATEQGFGQAPQGGAVYYNALFDVPNTDGRLRASMTAQVNVVMSEVKAVPVIPASALDKKDPDGRYTIKILDADKKAVERKVRIGLNNNVVAQVLEGLKPGEEVIVGDAQAPRAAAMGAFRGGRPGQ